MTLEHWTFYLWTYFWAVKLQQVKLLSESMIMYAMSAEVLSHASSRSKILQ